MLSSSEARPGLFRTTPWSVVLLLKEEDQAAREQALVSLCEAYWQPVFRYLRRVGYIHQDAEDLAQGFFAMILRKNAFSRVCQEKGKLRSWLLQCLNHFLMDQHDRETAAKRGARVPQALVNGDFMHAEATEGIDTLSPDKEYDRNWALRILDLSLQQLREEFEKKCPEADGALFDALLPHLDSRAGPAATFETMAERFQMPAATLRSHVHRLRKKLPDVVIEQVKTTLANPSAGEIREELEALRDYL